MQGLIQTHLLCLLDQLSHSITCNAQKVDMFSYDMALDTSDSTLMQTSGASTGSLSNMPLTTDMKEKEAERQDTIDRSHEVFLLGQLTLNSLGSLLVFFFPF